MEDSIFTTERLKLRKLSPEIFDHIYQNLSEAEQMAYLGLDSKEKLEAERKKYEEGLWTHNKQFLYFQLLDKESDRIIGWCGYHTWYLEHDRAEIGYQIFAEEYKRKGIMSEAISAVVAYGFNEMKLYRIEAFIGTDNTASIKLVSNLNFEKEGLLRGHYYTNDRYEDSLVYGLLRTNYTKA